MIVGGIDGAPVRLGGVEYIVAPLTFGQLRRLAPTIEKLVEIEGVPDDAAIEGITELAFASLSRNYPELPRESIADLIDLGNFGPLFKAIMGVSGMELRPPTPVPAPTGTSSMPTSSPAPAGPGNTSTSA